MSTPVFTLTDSLIINQPCNYPAEQRGREKDWKERDGEEERYGERGKTWVHCGWVREREKRKSRRDGWRTRRFLLKGDNKEFLKEQMKMSFLSPPVPATLPWVLWRDNEGEWEKVSVSQHETFCWNISTLPSLLPRFLKSWHFSSSSSLSSLPFSLCYFFLSFSFSRHVFHHSTPHSLLPVPSLFAPHYCSEDNRLRI